MEKNLVVKTPNEAHWGDHVFKATIGKGGFKQNKVEGDHGTPIGSFPLRAVYYRKDRVPKPHTVLPLFEIKEDDGWCDDIHHPSYNQPIQKPFKASHESLWREDHVYDIIITIGHNDAPPIPGKGSAIFIHLPHDDGRKTEGCLALNENDLRLFLKEATTKTEVVFKPEKGEA